jgi:hypothetical protein
MTRPSRLEQQTMREDGLSQNVLEQFTAAEQAVAEWERGRTRRTLADALDWIDELRRAFGDPEVDLTPWRGDDFRL